MSDGQQVLILGGSGRPLLCYCTGNRSAELDITLLEAHPSIGNPQPHGHPWLSANLIR